MLIKKLSLNQTPSARRLAVLGSTGSIGSSTLDIVRADRERFEIVALSAGKNIEKLLSQIVEFSPRYVSIADENDLKRVKESLPANIAKNTEMLFGADALKELVALDEVDTVVMALVGMRALPPLIAAIESGKRIALANKECLVAGGALVERALKGSEAFIIPVDSEHSSIFQLMQGESHISRYILTASGGPFLNTPKEKLSKVTPAEAVLHPRWNMGPKNSIDSATMVNKGLELMEASWLFGIASHYIDVVVHPQSIVHALVTLSDGATLAHLSQPDMKLPIAFALSYPNQRLENITQPLNFESLSALEFCPLDNLRFPAVKLARHALEAGQASTALFNIADEVAVEAFMAGAIRFDQIVETIEKALNMIETPACESVQQLLEFEQEVRAGLLGLHL